MALDQVRGDAASPEQQLLGRRGAVLGRHRAAIAAPLAFLTLAVWLYWPLFRHIGSSQMGGPDTALFTWWLAWTPHALLHGQSPLVSTWINAPHGVNAMWNTSVPLLGVVMTPVTETLGPFVSVNVLLILAPALSAWSAFGAARLFNLRNRSSFMVGLLYGFSTYDLAENSSGHLHLSFAVFPPLAAVLVQRLVTGEINPRRAGLLLGLAGVAQLWASEEFLATSVLLTVGTLAVLAIRAPFEVLVPAARRLARATAWALVVAVPLATPALYLQFFGPGHLTSGIPMAGMSTDLLTSITPTRQALVGKLVPTGTMNRIQVSDFDEITGYIGLPLIVLLVVSRRRIRTTSLRWCWIPLLLAGALAVGWSLRIAGHATVIRGPAQYTAKLPLLDSLQVVRFSAYVVFFSALLAGAAWDSAAEAGFRMRRLTTALVALTILAVLPWPSARITRLHEPTAFAAGKLLPGLPAGSTIATLPWPNTDDAHAMRWQADNGFHYKLLGAWAVVAGPGGAGVYGAATPELNATASFVAGLSKQPPTADKATLLAEIRTISGEARAIVVGPVGHADRVAAYLTRLLGEKPIVTGNVAIFPLHQH